MIDKELYLRCLVELQGDGDTESNHAQADDILCEILTDLGYGDIVAEYDKIGKWYA